MSKPNIAVVILTYNSHLHLPTLFASLKRQSLRHFDTFVFDNASPNKAVHTVCRAYPWVKIVCFPKNFGYGGGLHRAVKYLLPKKYAFFAFVNPDVRLAPNWLALLYQTLCANQNTAIAVPLSLSWDGKVVDCAGGTILNLPAGIFTGFLGGSKYKKLSLPIRTKAFPVFFGLTVATLITRDTFVKFGNFDRDYFMYFVDNDFSWRLLLAGKQILCQPKALVYHRGHSNNYARSLELIISGNAETALFYTYYKNLSLTNLLVFLPLVSIFRILLALGYLPRSPALTAKKLSGIWQFYRHLPTSKYHKARHFTQTLRVISDKEVLAQNPTSLFSTKALAKLIFPHLSQLTTKLK